MTIDDLKQIQNNTKDEINKMETYQKKLNIKKDVLSFLINVFDAASRQESQDYITVNFITYFPKIRNGRRNFNFESDLKLFDERKGIIKLVCEYIGLRYYVKEEKDIRHNYEGIEIIEHVLVPSRYLTDQISVDIDQEVNRVLSIKRYF